MKTRASEQFRQWMAGGHPMPEVVQSLMVSAQTINNWRSGRQTPQYRLRHAIMTLTGIDAGAWLVPLEATCAPE